MLPALTLALLSASSPQDTAILDAPVYRNEVFGIALPRPFDDWVFAPATSRGTTTVIFQPRGVSLREQLWGALALTNLRGPPRLAEIAEQRIQTSWRPLLGQSFTLLARESTSVAGLPAMHLVMAGAIDRAVLDVEEYLVARGYDLVVLQFRYPRGLARDSVAAGYQRVFRGLRIRGVAGNASAASAMERFLALAGSPWRLEAVDALVRPDTDAGALEVTARLELVNEGPAAADSVTVWLDPPAVLDSLRVHPHAPPARSLPALAPGAAPGLRVPAVPPGSRLTLLVSYHFGVGDAGVPGAPPVKHWLPLVTALEGPTGTPQSGARTTVRFELPVGLRAVSSGRLVSDLVAGEVRRATWQELEGGPAPPFAIGAFRPEPWRDARPALRFWVSVPAAPDRLDSLASLLSRAWRFYSRALGAVGLEELEVVLSDAPGSLTGASRSVLFLGATSEDSGWTPAIDIVLRALADRWIKGEGLVAESDTTGLARGLGAWLAVAARGVLESDSVRSRLVAWATRERLRLEQDGVLPDALPEDHPRRATMDAVSWVVALEAARAAAGEARFREAIRALGAEFRGSGATMEDLIGLLGEAGGAAMRNALLGRGR
jgi:hypothetical protein